MNVISNAVKEINERKSLLSPIYSEVEERPSSQVSELDKYSKRG